jgi:ABC-type lipoprotein release transport system permease subunit
MPDIGVLAVADVGFLNIRERAAELATIRSFGWRDAALARLVVTEGAIIGVTGSLTGAAAGLGAAAWFADYGWLGPPGVGLLERVKSVQLLSVSEPSG